MTRPPEDVWMDVNRPRMATLLGWFATAYGLYGLSILPRLNMDKGGILGVVGEFIGSILPLHPQGLLGSTWRLSHVVASVALAMGGLMVFRRRARGWQVVRWASTIMLVTMTVCLIRQVRIHSYMWGPTPGYNCNLMRSAAHRCLPELGLPVLLCGLAWSVSHAAEAADRSRRAGFGAVIDAQGTSPVPPEESEQLR